MIGIFEKEESIALFDACKTIFLRFGSTRGLNQTLLLVALGYLANLDRGFAWAYAAEMVLTSLLTLYSFHKRPHADSKPEVQP